MSLAGGDGEGRILALSQASHRGLSGKKHLGVTRGWTHLEGQLMPEDQESRVLVEVRSRVSVHCAMRMR